MKVQNPVSQNIRIFPKINKKLCKGIFKTTLISALNTWSGLL